MSTPEAIPPTWFEKRVEALVAIITKQNTEDYREALHKRATEVYHENEDPALAPPDNWVRALRTLMIETNMLSENEIDEKMTSVRKTLSESLLPESPNE